MKQDELDENVLIELIEIVNKFKIKEFYFKKEHLEVSMGVSNEIMYKNIVSDEISITKDSPNNNFEKIIIKSNYVAKIRLKMKKMIFL